MAGFQGNTSTNHLTSNTTLRKNISFGAFSVCSTRFRWPLGLQPGLMRAAFFVLAWNSSVIFIFNLNNYL